MHSQVPMLSPAVNEALFYCERRLKKKNVKMDNKLRWGINCVPKFKQRKLIVILQSLDRKKKVSKNPEWEVDCFLHRSDVEIFMEVKSEQFLLWWFWKEEIYTKKKNLSNEQKYTTNVQKVVKDEFAFSTLTDFHWPAVCPSPVSDTIMAGTWKKIRRREKEGGRRRKRRRSR